MPAPAAPTASVRRSLGVALAAGLGIALASTAIVISIVAIPLFALARFAEPGQGLDRPLIRDSLRYAIPVGVVLGTLTGAAVGRWVRRGGHLPREWD